ncbi:hypothetical protein [Clostridium sp. HBUAS56017]|uniref:hypothetical protein n=1 Tax=Clostridium sp. HBUAS56017 TaxID=2571128 RepID=UPI0011779416|nr:hypothetical protein [Clostridium sp. HBUAS56017]
MNNMNFESDEQRAEFAFDVFEELNENDPKLLTKVLQKRSGVKLNEFNILYDEFIKMHENPKNYIGVKPKTKGNILEEIIKMITIHTKIFDLYENVSSNSNEYDIILKPSEFAEKTYNAIPPIVYQPIICECKNYTKTIDVTWIGKLYSLLSLSRIKVGIIFSYEGITGEKSWEDARGLVKKIFLKDDIAIIDIGKNELQKIKDGQRFYDVVQKKYDNLVLMTNKDIEKNRYAHSSAERVQKIIKQIHEEVEYYRTKKQ